MNKIKIGAVIPLNPLIMEDEFKRLHELELDSCQITNFIQQYRTDETCEMLLTLSKKYKIEISAFWCGWSPNGTWNFYEGQETLGLVPDTFRANRLNELLNGVEFAKKLGVPDLVTHVGFMPENPYDPRYHAVISALKILCNACKNAGLYFNFETGQETPVTILRAIEDIGTGNVGINLDPSNLICYGKANPVDAMDVFGDYVRGIHVKDGFYPTNGRALGIEVPVGEGKVDFKGLMRELNNHKYKGHFTIERELFRADQREEQTRDIRRAKEILIEEYYKYNWDF